LAPEYANSGVLSGPTMATSVERAERTGPTTAASVPWKTAANRLYGPSTFSS
jgi:hypothetical protein